MALPLHRAVEEGATSFLFKPFDSIESKAELSEIVNRQIQRALLEKLKRTIPEDEKPQAVTEILAEQYTLVINLKTWDIYFEGIKLPSSKKGLQKRHKIFLFVLARHPNTAMSHEDIQNEARRLALKDFLDSSKNIRNQIRRTIKDVAKEYPEKINGNADFLKTVFPDMTQLTLPKGEVFSIYEPEEYPKV